MAAAKAAATASANTSNRHDVIVVGAGPAGLGAGIALKSMGIRFVILERHEIGASFARWPREMRLITPSFPSNEFGLPDLNAVTRNTSPALTLKTEHPTGREYALYLKRVNSLYRLPVRTGVEVRSVAPGRGGGFVLRTSAGAMKCRFVVWAAGEFQYPNAEPFPGAAHCIHNSRVKSWGDLEGDEFIVIGGYESGMDAACHLCDLGKRVTVFDGGSACGCTDSDPSVSLSPFTRDRLARASRTGRVRIVEGRVEAVEKTRDGRYLVRSAGQSFATKSAPVLATGFAGSLTLIRDLFHWNGDGRPELNVYDESTKTPGLYVTGPLLERNGTIFCFIYKFQQRLPVVAHNIAQKLGVDASPLERYWKTGDAGQGKTPKKKEKDKEKACAC
jgi:cation diffusion facilitator CzcD-associated flavoprotein CzcO